METRDPELRKELDATLQARAELGPEYESALIDSFLEKVEQRLDGTLDRRVRRHLAERHTAVVREDRAPHRWVPSASASVSARSRWCWPSRSPPSASRTPGSADSWWPGWGSSVSTRCTRHMDEPLTGRGSRGDRRTPGCPGGGTTTVPARDAVRVRAGCRVLATVEVREPLRTPCRRLGCRRVPLPTPTNLPDAC
ncbi:hypothetical protein GCM10010447_02440 [Streptomyces fulvorobeus]